MFLGQIGVEKYPDEDYVEGMDVDEYFHEYAEDDDWYEVEVLYHSCILPTLITISEHILHLLGSCLLFRLITQTGNVPMKLRHVVSTLFGLYALHHFFKELVVHLVVLVVATYLLFLLLNLIHVKSGLIISILSLAYLMGNEYYMKSDKWRELRGPAMLVIMKIISVAFDMDSGTLQRMPDMVEYSGYSLCVGTSVFGAWFSFNDYLNIYRNPIWDVKWMMRALRSIVLAIICCEVSVCTLEWLIPHGSSLWLGYYRDALQFRTSHYFVSFLSEGAAVVSGFGTQTDGTQFVVTEPTMIELPYSLVQVVVSWNKQMHQWLKIYVFRTSREYGGLFAVLMTYTVSSLLHGINYPIAAVLMSLGIYTYVEYTIRARCAVLLDACVAARRCPQPCRRHKHSPRLLPVSCFNWMWTILGLFHLTYLGCIIDTSDKPPDYPQVFEKWSNVNHVSHAVCFLTYLFYLCIK